MLLLMLLMLARILKLRYDLRRRTEKEREFLAQWRPLLLQEISGLNPAFQPLKRGEEEMFLKLWNHFQESLRGPARQRLNDVAVRCGGESHARRLLRQGELRGQLLALATLGHLSDRSSWEEIGALVHRPNSILSLAAVDALLKIDAAVALGELLPLMLAREDWPSGVLAMLIEEACEGGSFSALLDAATRLAASPQPDDLAKLRRALHLMEVVPPLVALPVARHVLASSTHEEVIAQCLKFLVDPADLPTVRQLAGHPAWAVRLQVAHALGRIGSLEDVPLLSRLLADAVWWVRYRSAQSLVSLARGEGAVLVCIAEQIDDRLGLDMLTMAMAEGAES